MQNGFLFTTAESHKDCMGGKPCLPGTRFPVSSLIAELSEGEDNLKEICDDYDISFDDAKAFMVELSGMLDV